MAHMRGGIRTTPKARRSRNGEESRNEEWRDEQSHDAHSNVGETERVISGLLGGGLVLRSVTRPLSPITGVGAMIGVTLLYRALTGYCPAYHSMGFSTRDKTDTSSLGRRKIHSRRALKIEESVVIARPAKDLYAFWRNLENLPAVMSQVRSVKTLNDRKSHWVIDTVPGAPTVEWDAEIINEVENERIGWRTLQGAMVGHAGSVQFEPVESGRSCKVTVTLQYDPPAGPVGAAIAGLFGQDPGRKIASDLERFKETMESKESASR